jgi:hypothetical protein
VRPASRLVLAIALIAAPIAALLAVASAAAAAPAAAHAHTKRVVVRPVQADGRPVHGYTVTREHIPGFTCQDPSTVAVDAGIDFCGFSATDTMACWKSTHHTALCLRDPWTKKLARIRYSGTFVEKAAVKHPLPQALRLMNGERCWVRDGGAWGWVTGHPSWSGAYGCQHGDVYGPGTGISKRTDPWRVHEVYDAGSPDQKIVDRRVGTAYFVGTAA